MYPVGTEKSWSFGHSFEMTVDFCVWVLEKDGLQVPPFNAHPDGDGTLRSAGLQAQEWRSWTARVVQLQSQESQASVRREKTRPDPSSFFIADAHNPPASWSGNVGVRKRLDELWEQYQPLSNMRSEWVPSLARPWVSVMHPLMHQLCNDFPPSNVRLPALVLYLVGYSQQVEYLVPPISLIMTIVDGHIDLETFRLHVLHAAKSLAMAQPS
jgi:hypothetical protein